MRGGGDSALIRETLMGGFKGEMLDNNAPSATTPIHIEQRYLATFTFKAFMRGGRETC